MTIDSVHKTPYSEPVSLLYAAEITSSGQSSVISEDAGTVPGTLPSILYYYSRSVFAAKSEESIGMTMANSIPIHIVHAAKLESTCRSRQNSKC